MRKTASFVPRRPLFAALFPTLLLAAATSGCNPTYAPPVRAVHYGAPGRVRAGDVEVGGTLAGVFAPTGGSLHVAVGLHDWVSLEAGGTFAAAPAGPQRSMLVMGWAGPRFTLPRNPHGASLLLDGELGIGGGVGGALCRDRPNGRTECDYDGRSWSDRVAFGGYLGGGIGVGYQWFSLYGRARLEESVASGIPVTHWPSAMLGLGFDLAPRVSLDVGGGYLGYSNERSSENGWFYQTGLTVRFPQVR